MDITMIIEAVIKLLFAIVITFGAYYGKPLLKQFLSDKQNQKAVEVVSLLIKTAEQLYLNGFFDGAIDDAKARKDYVVTAAKEALEKQGITFDEAYLETLVEGLLQETKEDFYLSKSTQESVR